MKNLWVEEGTITPEKVPCQWTFLRGKKPSAFFTILAICFDRQNQSQSRMDEWFLQSGKF